jgi:Holliday junction resolvase RusA-like endonuclease
VPTFPPSLPNSGQPQRLPASLPAVVLVLPPPPTTNRMWRHQANRIRTSSTGKRYRAPVTLSPEYQAWLDTAGWLCVVQMRDQAALPGYFRPVIRYPASARRDEDAWPKPILDLLQRQQVIRNDNGSRGLSLVPEPRLDVRVELHDLGGDIAAAKTRRCYAKPRSHKPTIGKINRYRKAGVLV